jgi:hypothetical protein
LGKKEGEREARKGEGQDKKFTGNKKYYSTKFH